MSDALLLTQDGGKSGDLKVVSLSMIRVKYLRFKTKTLTLMLRTETFRSLIEEMEMISDNNGRSSMLINTLNQRRESSTSNSVFMLKETSMLFQLYQVVDTLILSITETWLSRLQMVETLKSGTSINNLRPLEPD
jgi:hypothetical protein